MPNNSLEQHSGALVLDAVQNLRTIENTRELLLQNIGKNARLFIDCSGVEEADIAIVQLLISARKTAAQLGTDLRLAAVSSAFKGVVDRAGVLGAAGNDPFWNGDAP
jgi:anti-anti-sigma regulatory factor